MKRFLVMAALIGAVVVVAGCSKKQPTTPPTPVKAAPVSSTIKTMPAKPITSTAPQTHMKALAAKSAPKPSTTGGG